MTMLKMTAPSRWQRETQQLRQSAAQFLAWWRGELKALLPGRVQRLLAQRGNRLVVEWMGETARLRLHNGGETRTLEATANGARPRLPRLDRVELRLPTEAVLEARLPLPLAAEENLREVIGFEMDRHTPFTAEQVYYDYRLLDRDPAREQLHLALYLIPRPELERRLAPLADWGMPATTVSLVDGQGERRELPGLLPPRERAVRHGGRRGLYWLTLLAGVLLLSALLLPLVTSLALSARYEARLALLRSEAQEAQQLRGELQRRAAQASFLTRKRAERPLTVALLDEMTRLLPDHTWLSRFELEGDGLRLQGESEAASSLLGLIEGSPRFRDTHFVSPVTRNPRTDRERFVIELHIAEEAKP